MTLMQQYEKAWHRWLEAVDKRMSRATVAATRTVVFDLAERVTNTPPSER